MMLGMHQNRIWLAFLVTFSLVALWHTAILAFKTYRYSSLTAPASPTNTEWSVAKLGTERYSLHVKYAFSFNNQSYQNEETLSRSLFRNSFAANKALQKKGESVIWFSPQNPHLSTMDKFFPVKEAFYAGIMWLLLLYFFWLGSYVHRRLRWN